MLVHELLAPYRLVLASASPRRRQLLGDCGLPFVQAEPFHVEELYPDTLPAQEVPTYLSRLKSMAYPIALAANEILITADTVVILRGEIIGKPVDRSHAIDTLTCLSGHTHEVITGVTLRSASHIHSFDSRTEVVFAPLTKEQIAYYVDTYQPYDKAGAYGIQEWIGYVGIEAIHGSFYNVMGLPVQKLLNELPKFIAQ